MTKRKQDVKTNGLKKGPSRREFWDILAICLLVLISGCENPSGRAVSIKQIEKLEQEKTQLQSEIGLLNTENDNLKKQIHILSGLPKEVKGENIYCLKRIKIHGYTNIYDKDEDGKKESLNIYIQPIDQDGDIIKAAGVVEVQLWDLNKDSGEALIGQWTITPEKLRKCWLATLVTMNYRLIFNVLDKVEQYEEPLTVKVTFTDLLSGKVFHEQRVIKPHYKGNS
jgi:cell division protein FtsB